MYIFDITITLYTVLDMSGGNDGIRCRHDIEWAGVK